MTKNMTAVGTAQSESGEILVAISTAAGPITMGTNYARYFVTLLLLVIEQAEKMNGDSHD